MNNRLGEIIEERCIQPSKLARKVGVHRNTVANLVAGSEPRLYLAYRIARALGCSVYDIWPDIEE